MGKRRSRNPRYNDDQNIVMLSNNQQAIMDGPKKKSWSIHDISSIRPLTEKQEDMFQSWFQGDNVCAHGSAGTGKTFLAFYLALSEILERGVCKKVIVVRSAVATREVGFLKGTLEEKTLQYETPYHSICQELFGRKTTYQDMKDNNLIEFVTTSFIRGTTWDNAIVIIDEFQNMTFEEIDSVMTRIGKNTRVILCGDDKKQCDLKHHEVPCAQRLVASVDRMRSFSTVNFTRTDIVRSEFVKDWLIASEDVA